LQLTCESLHPGYVVVLTLPGTDEVIGSQLELLCAYQDASEDTETLDLELNLYPKAPKRVITEVDEPEEPKSAKHCGRWVPSEIALFKKGVENFGWGSWSRIADFVETRTNLQVKTFAKTPAGLESKSEVSFLPVLEKIADGLTEVSKNVTREMTKDL
jgi:hypothetical protein